MKNILSIESIAVVVLIVSVNFSSVVNAEVVKESREEYFELEKTNLIEKLESLLISQDECYPKLLTKIINEITNKIENNAWILDFLIDYLEWILYLYYHYLQYNYEKSGHFWPILSLFEAFFEAIYGTIFIISWTLGMILYIIIVGILDKILSNIEVTEPLIYPFLV